MEIDGHPTQDILDELARRGAVRVDGSSSGPNADGVRFITENLGDLSGFWLFLPREVFNTGMDEIPR
jgi:hypothetical protein